MAELTDGSLRALIRLLPPARALAEELEKSLHLDIFGGTGDMAVRSFQALQSTAAQITGDAYLTALAITNTEGLSDKEKVSLALLAAGQLSAYLEGQTGVSHGKTGGTNIQTAPNININIGGGSAQEAVEIMKQALQATEKGEK